MSLAERAGVRRRHEPTAAERVARQQRLGLSVAKSLLAQAEAEQAPAPAPAPPAPKLRAVPSVPPTSTSKVTAPTPEPEFEHRPAAEYVRDNTAARRLAEVMRPLTELAELLTSPARPEPEPTTKAAPDPVELRAAQRARELAVELLTEKAAAYIQTQGYYVSSANQCVETGEALLTLSRREPGGTLADGFFTAMEEGAGFKLEPDSHSDYIVFRRAPRPRVQE